MKLDISPLEKAITQIEESLAFARSPGAKSNERLYFQFRAASIQAFEYTYSLIFKFLRRALELEAEEPDLIDEYGFRDLLRAAKEAGLLQDTESWVKYREMRNIISHTYDGEKAERIYHILPSFAEDAKNFYKRLKEKLEKEK